MIEIAKQTGEASPSVSAASIACYTFTYVGGLLKRLAIEPHVDAEAETDQAFELFKSLSKRPFTPVGTESSR